jgi:hypothetical protein
MQNFMFRSAHFVDEESKVPSMSKTTAIGAIISFGEFRNNRNVKLHDKI